MSTKVSTEISAAISTTTVPIINIYVRHSQDCPNKGDETYRRCNCWKHLRWRHDGVQYRKATKSKTWAGAERVRREVEASYEKGNKDQATTVKAAIDEFLKSKQGENNGPDSIYRNRLLLNRFLQYCDKIGRFHLRDVTLPDLTAYRSEWTEYKSSVARQKVQERLKGFFRFAHNAGYISNNPASKLSAIKVDHIPTLPLEPKEYEALLSKIPIVFNRDKRKQDRVRAFIRCMRHTGLAIRDTVCLERSRIIFDPKKKITRVVVARQKTKVDVSVPISPDLAAELKAVATGNATYVFWNPVGGGKAKSAVTRWQHDLKKLFREAGLEDGHPHQLRDTAAVEWLQAGVPLEEVSKLLGHTSIKTTEKHYAPWVKARQDRLDQVVMATWK